MQVKHNKAGTWDKGIVIKEGKDTDQENYEDALQSYHAYLGAYAYGQNEKTDFVDCMITEGMSTNILKHEQWVRRTEVQPAE
jgi:hypothetical protein